MYSSIIPLVYIPISILMSNHNHNHILLYKLVYLDTNK